MAPFFEIVLGPCSNTGDRYFQPPAPLYKYTVEHLHAKDEDVSEIMVAEPVQLRRKKGCFSREKCKLFIKQHVEQGDRNIFVIKKSTRDQYHLDKVSFDQIFDGPMPNFDSSRKLDKAIKSPEKSVKKKQKQDKVGKKRQMSLDKFLMQNNNGVTNGSNAKLLERMRQREEEMKLLKQQKKEEKEALKLKKKEEDNLMIGQLKDWYKPKEDLELVDQKVMIIL